jgi:hypothetical protein
MFVEEFNLFSIFMIKNFFFNFFTYVTLNENKPFKNVVKSSLPQKIKLFPTEIYEMHFMLDKRKR